jgi:hypothetical protein
MRKKAVCVVCACLLLMGSSVPCHAFSDGSPEAVAADGLVVRPVCLAATVIGSAVFLVCLPVAAITKSTTKTANALVGAPAKATFCRPLGDLSTLGGASM